VFCGTTNKAEFITDETGSRRYWPIQVGKIDTDWIEHNRSQLWAEAVVAYKNGERWYLENEVQSELDTQSSDFRQFDPWQEIIERYVRANGINCSTTDLMEQALKLEKYQMTRASEMRVGDIMRQLGYERVRRRVFGDRKYVWVAMKEDNVIEIEKPAVVVDNEDVKGS
jgi:putative DNA primase/helicase